MTRLHMALGLLLLFSAPAFAQQPEETAPEAVRPPTIGFGIIFNDFTTARAIRSSSLQSAIINKQFAKLGDMAPGIAVIYAKGLWPHIDFAGTVGFSSGQIVLQNKPDQVQNTSMLAADAAIQAKMFPESFIVIPYLSAGVGATVVKGYYGATLPLGAGIRVRVSEALSLAVQSQYRLAVTESSGYHFMHGLTVYGRL